MFATQKIRLPAARRRLPQALALIAALPAIALAVALVSLSPYPRGDSAGYATAYPAGLALHVPVPTHPGGEVFGDYGQPSAVVELNGQLYVLDSGNDRILVQDGAGIVRHVIREPADGSYAFDGPLGIASDGRDLYVANTGAAQLLVIDTNGTLLRTVDLALDTSGERPRPVDLFVDSNGSLVVSDAANNRLLFYGAGGSFQRAAGTGARAAGGEGFNGPAGLTRDGSGFTYVADSLNGRVVKLSPDGEIVGQFGRPGDTAGTLSRPKDVAIDEAGNVYISDGLLAAVQIFDAGGEYLGFIGREDTDDPRSGSLFAAPAGLLVRAGKLYVIDRFHGLFVFGLPDYGP
jgi:sugar lactone lactonase YvrE